MAERLLLSIETSCDETAIALIDISRPLDSFDKASSAILADLIASQTDLHAAYGGVVPEIAAREHLNVLPALLGRAFSSSGRSARDIAAIAATRGPGLKGCLLVGLSFAKALARSLGVPLIPLNHLEGHIFAGELNDEGAKVELPLLTLVVSGGHTLLVSSASFREYRIIARTRDDAAGEAFDKSAALLGLPYPGGPALSRLAEGGDPTRFRLPVGMPKDPSSFSFSGLKTAVSRLVATFDGGRVPEDDRADLAASVEHAIVNALVTKTLDAIRSEKPRSFVLTGGVAANRTLRSRLSEALTPLGIALIAPPARWCTDNAAMMGILGARVFERNRDAYARGPADGTLGLDVPPDISALARWPLDAGPLL